MTLELGIPTPDDAQAIANMTIASSLVEGELARAAFLTPQPSEAALTWFANAVKKNLGESQQRVIRDSETGEIISALRYSFVPFDNSESWKHRSEGPVPPADLFNAELLAYADGTQFQKRVEHMGNRAFIHVHALYTSPKAYRRGAGSMMMQYAVEQAEKYNLPMFLLATRLGKSLYVKFGFESKEEVVFNIKDGVTETQTVMVRPQPAPSKPATVPALPLRPVKIVPLEATMDDALAFGNCTTAAFKSEPLIELAFYSAEQEPRDVAAAKLLEEMKKPDEFLFHKAIDAETGEALGFSKWLLVADPHPRTYPWGKEWPKGANKPLCEAMFQQVEDRREEYFRERNSPYIYCCSLMILPQAQRRGVGSALLRAGLQIGDERKWPAYINASPAGAELYRKFGWEDYTSVTVNLKDFGGSDHEDTTVGLVRPVGAKIQPRKEIAT